MTQASDEARGFPRELLPLFTETDVARILGVSVRTVQAWRVRQTGPAYVRIGANIRYTQKGILDYLEARTVGRD